MNHADSADQLRQALLELFLVVLGLRILQLPANLVRPRLHGAGLSSAGDNDRVFGGNPDLPGLSEIIKLERFELHAEILEDRLAAGKNRQVLEHGLSALSIGRSLHRRAGKHTLELVDHQGREHLGLHVLGNQQQRPLGRQDLLHDRKQVGKLGQLLLVDENERLLELAEHLVAIGNEMRREIAAVKFHSLDGLDMGLDLLALLDGDDSVLSHRLEGIGDALANLPVLVGRHGGQVNDLVLGLDRGGQSLQAFERLVDSEANSTRQDHRVHSANNVLQTPEVDALGQDGCRGRAISGLVGGLLSRLTNQLRSHVFVRIDEVNLLSDDSSILGNNRLAPAAVDNRIGADRSQRRLDRPGEFFNARPGGKLGFEVENHLFRCSGHSNRSLK